MSNPEVPSSHDSPNGSARALAERSGKQRNEAVAARDGRDGRPKQDEVGDVAADTKPRLLSLVAAAAYLGLSTWTTRTLIANGVLRCVRLPSLRRHGEGMRRILIDVRDLDTLIEKSKDDRPT